MVSICVPVLGTLVSFGARVAEEFARRLAGRLVASKPTGFARHYIGPDYPLFVEPAVQEALLPTDFALAGCPQTSCRREVPQTHCA